MSNKSLNSYEKIFTDLKSLIGEYKINVDFQNIRFLCDFEKSLLKAIKNKFSDSKINGCYFHYIKSIWKKLRNFGLTKKSNIDKTKIIAFALKLYPFILKEKKSIFINEIYEYALNIDNKYKSFIKYFKKNWEKSEFLNFDVLSNGEISNRTNNIVESFHHKLNAHIEYPHPKISILIEKLKFFSIDYYRAYVGKMFETKNVKIFTQNIYNDIFNYLKKFLIKYDYNIDIKLLLQDTGETKKELDEICRKIIHELYNITINEEGKNLNKNNDDENDVIPEDIINDLDNDWWRNNGSQHNIEDLKKDSDENFRPFDVDSDIVKKKTKS